MRLMAFVGVAALGLWSGCGTKKKSSTATTPATAAPTSQTGNIDLETGSGSAVDDPSAQKDLTNAQVLSAVQALADGGSAPTATAGNVDVSAGLVDFADARTCTASTLPSVTSMASPDGTLTWSLPAGTTTVTVTRVYTGTNGGLAYINNKDNGSASAESEVWFPGPYFGLQNIKPDSATVNYGRVPASGVPAVIPASGAPAGSSGAVGSVGWRSYDGSWTGAPVWQGGACCVGYVNSQPEAIAKTQNQVVYQTAHMPVVSANASASGAGGTYSPTELYALKSSTPLKAYSVLGQNDANGSVPSFTTTGVGMVSGAAVPLVQAGKVTTPGLPVEIFNPPAAIACDKTGQSADVGWQYSQNAAGLTRQSNVRITTLRTYASGATSEVATTGVRLTTAADPALTPPVSSSPSSPYFDFNAGTLSNSFSVSIGDKAAPNTSSSEFRGPKGKARPVVTNTLYSSSPFQVSVTRNINDSTWPWVTKTVASGSIATTHAVGSTAPVAQATTTFTGLVFKNTGDKVKSCVPTAGQITTVIAPLDNTKATITVALKFGASTGVPAASGVTVTVTCSGGAANAKNCTAQPETDNADYKPSGCNF